MKFLRTAGFLFLIFLMVGCSRKQEIPQAKDVGPEHAYRQFFIALLAPQETMVRSLILDHPNASILWESGSYPPAVAEKLREQYEPMEISRPIPAPGTETEVALMSSAFPLPLVAKQLDGKWMIDAEPLIRLRKSAKEFRDGKK